MVRKMTGRVVLVAAVAASAGCGDGGGAKPCGPLDGVYLNTYEERSGDCGSFENVIAVDPDEEGFDDGCTGMQRNPTDCDLELDITCPTHNDLGDLTGYISVRGALSQVDGPDRAEGTVSMDLYDVDRTLVCSSTGTMSYVRQ